MFEQASRQKLRFGSAQGNLSVEDLWDLPLTSARGKANLNDVAKEVSRQLKTESEEDFVNPKSGADKLLQLKLDIIKRIISVRQVENEAERSATDRRQQKARILEILAKKKDAALESKSEEELTAMVNGL